MHRLPIFHDDRSFHDQTERMFREMQEKMGFHHHNPASAAATTDSFQSFLNGAVSAPNWPTSASTNWSTTATDGGGPRGAATGADQTFFELWPRTAVAPSGGLQSQTMTSETTSSSDFNRPINTQPETLDDATIRSLFVDLDPTQRDQGQGRMFRMSFDVHQYNPGDISVRSEDRCLVVEAKHSDNRNGNKVAREFCRRIQLPPAVDPEKLSSTMSSDGILTVQAPVPPPYQAALTGSTASGLEVPGGPSVMTGRGLDPRQSMEQLRVSPMTVQFDSTGSAAGSMRSRSPLLGMPPSTTMTTTSTTRISPMPFVAATSGSGGLLQPGFTPISDISIQVPPMAAPPVQLFPTPLSVIPPLQSPMAVNMPAVSVDPVTGRRRVDLLLDLGPPYTADDVVVKVDNGQRLIIEARHEERQNKGHVSTSSMQKQFDLGEDVDSATVKAMMRADGKLSVTAFVRQ